MELENPLLLTHNAKYLKYDCISVCAEVGIGNRYIEGKCHGKCKVFVICTPKWKYEIIIIGTSVGVIL